MKTGVKTRAKLALLSVAIPIVGSSSAWGCNFQVPFDLLSSKENQLACRASTDRVIYEAQSVVDEKNTEGGPKYTAEKPSDCHGTEIPNGVALSVTIHAQGLAPDSPQVQSVCAIASQRIQALMLNGTSINRGIPNTAAKRRLHENTVPAAAAPGLDSGTGQ